MKRASGGRSGGVSGLFMRLADIRLTQALLFSMAFMCVAATIIPQEPYRSVQGVTPAGRVLMLLSPRDVFHSLWFLAAGLVMALNLSLCTWMQARRSLRAARVRMPSALVEEVRIPSQGDPESVSGELVKILSGTHRARLHAWGSSAVVTGGKGGVRSLGLLSVHAGILLVLVASALAFCGFKGTMAIPEGGAQDVVRLQDGSERRLGFHVGCEGFSVEYYENGMPREYRSDIYFRGDGGVIRRRVLVNHPVTHEGILFSQSGYDERLEASLEVRGPSGTRGLKAGEGAAFGLGDGVHRVLVVRVYEDMMRMGPGVRLLVETPEGGHDLWIFRDIEGIVERYPGIITDVPQFDPSGVKPYTFKLEGVGKKTMTILSVNRDPGVPAAAAGALLFTVGIILAFLVVQERVWVSFEPGDKGEVTVRIAMRRNGRAVPVDPHMLEKVRGIGGAS